MPHIMLTVDGQERVNFRVQPGGRLPHDIANCMQPGARPEPWMKAFIFASAEAVVNNEDLVAMAATSECGQDLTSVIDAIVAIVRRGGWVLAANTPKHYEARADIWDSRNPGDN